MKIISYIWSIIIGIVGTLVAVAVTSSVYDSDNLITVSILVIIYASIRSLGIGLAVIFMYFSKGTAEELAELRKLISHDDEDYTARQHDLDEMYRRQKHQYIKIVIDSIFNSLIYIIGILGLLNSL